MWLWIEWNVGLFGQSWYPKTLLIIVGRLFKSILHFTRFFSMITLFFQVWFSLNNFTQFPRCTSLKEKKKKPTNVYMEIREKKMENEWMAIFLETLFPSWLPLIYCTSLARSLSQLSTLAPINNPSTIT